MKRFNKFKTPFRNRRKKSAHSEFMKFQLLAIVWMLSSVKSLNKIENLQKRLCYQTIKLRFVLSDYESSYNELLWLSGSCATNVRLNPLSAKLTKWPNTLKQFVVSLPMNCLSVFGHFVGLALKGLKEIFV